MSFAPDVPRRHTCTKEQPWDQHKHGPRAIHPDALFLGSGGQDSVEYDRYRCPHCGKYFEVEIAQ